MGRWLETGMAGRVLENECVEPQLSLSITGGKGSDEGRTPLPAEQHRAGRVGRASSLPLQSPSLTSSSWCAGPFFQAQQGVASSAERQASDPIAPFLLCPGGREGGSREAESRGVPGRSSHPPVLGQAVHLPGSEGRSLLATTVSQSLSACLCSCPTPQLSSPFSPASQPQPHPSPSSTNHRSPLLAPPYPRYSVYL